MILIILTMIIFISGIVKLIQDDEFDINGLLLTTFGSVLLFGIIIALSYNSYLNEIIPLQYKEDIKMIESYKSNISEYERSEIIQLINKNNKIIIEQRMIRNNPWIGVFCIKKVADLEIIEYIDIISSKK